MVLGTGEIYLDERLKAAKKLGCRCVVETKTVETLKKSIDWLKINKF